MYRRLSQYHDIQIVYITLLLRRMISLFADMLLMSTTRRSCHHFVPVCIWSLFFLSSFQSSTTLTSMTKAAADEHPEWRTPRRRQPEPLDCSEGLQRCRENLKCRTLLNTLDRVCDRSSALLCTVVVQFLTTACRVPVAKSEPIKMQTKPGK